MYMYLYVMTIGFAGLYRRNIRVGAGRFELPTSCSQSRRASQAALRPEIESREIYSQFLLELTAAFMLTGSVRLSNRRLDQLGGFSAGLGIFWLTNMISQPLEFIMVGKVNDDPSATLVGLSQIHFRSQYPAKRLGQLG